MKNLTAKELEVLKIVKDYQNEEGHSEFLSTDAKTKSVAGVCSSLQKKGMIYDSYSNVSADDFYGMNGSSKRYKMWCLTCEGVDIVGKPKGWY
jgi:hypothetical protein